MTDFRKVVRFAFLSRICRGIISTFLLMFGIALNNLLKTMIDIFERLRYDLSITPQVCFLEKLLNDKYDPVQRRIYIEEAEDIIGYFFFRVSDPVDNKFYFNRAWFVEDTRYGNAGVGFVVVLPMDIAATAQMRALINRYKLISIKYQIINK